MKIWNNIDSFNAKRPIVTIGSFDGVHRGHLEVLRQLDNIARLAKGETVVITFHPHPIQVLAPDKKFDQLTTIDEKIYLMEKAGVNHLVILPFSKELAELTYKQFINQLLIDKICMHGLLIGHDNTIGKNKEGDFEKLNVYSKEHNFALYVHSELKVEEGKLSSTYIRKLLNAGKLFEASKLLGHPYFITGKVTRGQQLGNKLGFPTANIFPTEHKFIPANGAYVVKVEYDNTIHNGMMNIGTRPTIDEESKKLILETHVFDFTEDLYGKDIRICVLRKIRDEHKFEDVEALRQRLKEDKAFALEILEKEFNQ